MRKIVYIIPGFREKANLKRYKEIIRFFKARKFHTVPIIISWKYGVMSKYVGEFLKQLKHEKNDEVYVLGFSFGAMIAFISAVNIKPKVIFLCSLSPYFKEDLTRLPKSWKKMVGKRRVNDLKNISFSALVKKLNVKRFLYMVMLNQKECTKE